MSNTYCWDQLPTDVVEDSVPAGIPANDRKQNIQSFGVHREETVTGESYDSCYESQGCSIVNSVCDSSIVSLVKTENIDVSDSIIQKLENIQIADTDEEDKGIYSITEENPRPPIYVKDMDGDTQLHIAIIQQFFVMTLQMIKLAPSAEHLNIRNNIGQAPMHLAVLTRQHDVVDVLLRSGADPDITDFEGNTPLHIACREGDEKSVKILTQSLKQNVNFLNFYGLSMLHLAAANNHYIIIYYLVEKYGANINIKDGKSGRTILHFVAENDNEHLVEMLISWNADIEALTYDNATPLQLAAGKGHHRIVRMLLSYGADPLQLSACSDSEEVDITD